SGGPHAVGDVNNYQPNEVIYDLNIPILGICYGMQLITTQFDGIIQAMTEREYEQTTVKLDTSAALFKDLSSEQKVYLSKGVEFNINDAFIIDGTDRLNHTVMIMNKEKSYFRINFY